MYYITVFDPMALVANGAYKGARCYLSSDIRDSTYFWSRWFMELFNHKEDAEAIIEDMKKHNYYRDDITKHIDINSIEIREFKEIE